MNLYLISLFLIPFPIENNRKFLYKNPQSSDKSHFPYFVKLIF